MLFFLVSLFLSFFPPSSPCRSSSNWVLVSFSFHHAVFFSLLYICLCFIIAVRQPSPNQRMHETTGFSYSFLVTIGARLPISLFFSTLELDYYYQRCGSEQKRLIKVRINTSLFFSFSSTQRHRSCRCRSEWIIRMITIGGMAKRMAQPMRNKTTSVKKRKRSNRSLFFFCNNLSVNEKHHNILKWWSRRNIYKHSINASVLYTESCMKVKWADHADWKELSFKLVPLTGQHSKLPSHLTTYSFFFLSSTLTLASILFILIRILLASSSSTSIHLTSLTCSVWLNRH